jgi:TolA-binding protein
MKEMNKIKGLTGSLIFTFLLGFVLHSAAQKTASYTDPDARFKQGIELFEKMEFASAQVCFIQASQNRADKHSLLNSEADYYSALCAMELFHKDAEYLLKKFVHDHPESPRVRTVYFNLGKYNYRKKSYKDAIDWFNQVEVYDLNEEEKAEFYFKRGYSYLEKEMPSKAKSDFEEVKDKESQYSIPSTYYEAHILYTEKNYELSLQLFLKLEKDPTFGSVVPYYIAQIYYLQKKYAEVIAYAPGLLDSASTKRAPELARILGESYFKTNKYKEAIPYFERYRKTNSMSRSDAYELGFSYYQSGDYDNAIAGLKEAVGGDDSLAQNAYYHLGSCYLKKSNKHFAQNAFGEASRLHFDKAIREDALFSFAELTYELSYSPFNQAIKALQQYISEYPGTAKADEAYSYLVKINLVTKNYEDALKSIESIKNLNEVLKPVYQQIAYNRGVELYSNFDYDGAIRMFGRSMKYPTDPVTTALAKYWIAEGSYQKAERSGDPALYETAIDNYKIYMVEPGAPRTPMYNTLQYNIGYALFHLKQYDEAAIAFRKYVMQKNESPEKICNAYLRIGDASYVKSRFADAAEYYDLAFNTRTGKYAEKDYALYQRGMALGLEKKYETKMSALSSLLNMYPKSGYVPAARYEIGHTYQLLDRKDEAIPFYEKLIAENNGSPYVRKAYLNLGLIYSNLNNTEKALQSYQNVMKADSKSQEAKEANIQIREVYKGKNDIAGLEQYDRSMGNHVATSAYDSLEFASAKSVYDDGDCKQASIGFSKYLQKYPSGTYAVEANFMKAECDLKNNDLETALIGYNFVVAQASGKYTDPALRRAAAISFNKNDFKTAYEYYGRLELRPEYAHDARVGMMRSAWNLKAYDNAMVAANKILTEESPVPALANEAHLILARSAMEKQNYDLAYNEYALATAGAKNETAAEGRYTMALIQNVRKEYKQAEKTLFELIRLDAQYKTWVGKSFLLLSDNYLALSDTFQAKFVLTSFIEHTDIADLKTLAQEKLKVIQDAEKAKAEARKEKDLIVPLNNEQDKKLFEEDKPGSPQ